MKEKEFFITGHIYDEADEIHYSLHLHVDPNTVDLTKMTEKMFLEMNVRMNERINNYKGVIDEEWAGSNTND